MRRLFLILFFVFAAIHMSGQKLDSLKIVGTNPNFKLKAYLTIWSTGNYETRVELDSTTDVFQVSFYYQFCTGFPINSQRDTLIPIPNKYLNNLNVLVRTVEDSNTVDSNCTIINLPTTMDSMFIYPTSLIPQYIMSNRVIIYPNPIYSSSATISSIKGEEILELEITSLQGAVVSKPLLNRSTFSTEQLTSGIYILKIHTNKGIIRKKIVVQHE